MCALLHSLGFSTIPPQPFVGPLSCIFSTWLAPLQLTIIWHFQGLYRISHSHLIKQSPVSYLTAVLRRASISFRNLASLETRLLLDRVENFISIEPYWLSLLYFLLLLLPLFIDSEDAEGAEEKCRQLGFKSVVSARTARFLVPPAVFVARNILLSILQGPAGVPPKAVTRQIAAIILSFESLHTRIKALFS